MTGLATCTRSSFHAIAKARAVRDTSHTEQQTGRSYVTTYDRDGRLVALAVYTATGAASYFVRTDA